MKERLAILGMTAMIALTGCGKTYKLEFDGYGFESAKKAYAEGETVTVRYDMVASDTDYRFYTDSGDVVLKQEFDGSHGYVFTFVMPAHDVKISVSSRNTMTADPAVTVGAYTTGEDALAEGEWLCPECGAHNSGGYCSQCGSKKPDAD